MNLLVDVCLVWFGLFWFVFCFVLFVLFCFVLFRFVSFCFVSLQTKKRRRHILLFMRKWFHSWRLRCSLLSSCSPFIRKLHNGLKLFYKANQQRRKLKNKEK